MNIYIYNYLCVFIYICVIGYYTILCIRRGNRTEKKANQRRKPRIHVIASNTCSLLDTVSSFLYSIKHLDTLIIKHVIFA